MDGTFASIFGHVIEYVGTQAYPFHTCRVSGHVFGPQRYGFMISYTLLVSNPLQFILGLWLHVYHPARSLAPIRLLTPEQLCIAFCATTLTAIVGAVQTAVSSAPPPLVRSAGLLLALL